MIALARRKHQRATEEIGLLCSAMNTSEPCMLMMRGKRLRRATMAATGPLGTTQWACITSNLILPVSRHSAHRLLANTTGVSG